MSLLVKGSLWKVGWRSDCVFMRMRYSRPGQRVPLCPTITASHFTPLGNIRRYSLHTCTYNTCSVYIDQQISFSARPQGSFLCRLYCTSPHCHYWYAVCIVFQLTSTQMSKFLSFDFQSQTMQIANHEVEVLLSKCCQKSSWIFVISTMLRIFQNMTPPIPQLSMFSWNIASQL